MSNLTHQEALDEMLALFTAVWDSTGHEVFWPNVKEQRETDNTPFVRVGVEHTISRQAAIGGSNRPFRRNGFLIFQLFTLIGNGLQESYTLGKIIIDAYEGKSSPGGVWFRDVSYQEVGEDGTFFQANIQITFEYDEVK